MMSYSKNRNSAIDPYQDKNEASAKHKKWKTILVLVGFERLPQRRVAWKSKPRVSLFHLVSQNDAVYHTHVPLYNKTQSRLFDVVSIYINNQTHPVMHQEKFLHTQYHVFVKVLESILILILCRHIGACLECNAVFVYLNDFNYNPSFITLFSLLTLALLL